MRGNGKNKNGPNATSRSQARLSVTLREETSGKKHGNVNPKTMCKLDHLKNIAVWAAVEASVPSLGAFLGERLAATTEALGLRADPASFVCERCESILEPGSNCTVRIERNKSNKRRQKHKKSNPTTKNNVVYRCHFCSHRNLVRGTPKDHLKEICPRKAKPPVKLEAPHVDAIGLPTSGEQNLEMSCPETPSPATGLSLLDSKRRKRNRSSVKKVTGDASAINADDEEKSKQGSTKRRKRSWTSLKEIAESGSKKFANVTVPFFI
ncbi:Unknown protein [Striga hermonthica]|uniref:Uncharacterized protein n=1 Tax=Striga hermonthica TaxID=68872 RepID=A0A9N7N304_STRHE|nr:Unknown protein [Striga hermonthica]